MASLHTGDLVHSKHRVGVEPNEKPVINHRLRAKAIFRIGLKDENCVTVEVTSLSVIFCRAKQHACMPVMATSMHHYIICGFLIATSSPFKRKSIHISPESNTTCETAALKKHNNAGNANALMYLKAKRFE